MSSLHKYTSVDVVTIAAPKFQGKQYSRLLGLPAGNAGSALQALGGIVELAERGNIVNADLRACVAYAAGRGVSGRQLSGIFDYSRSKQIAMSGSITADHIDIYDEVGNCHFFGNSDGLRYSLFYNGNPQPVTLEIRDNNFRGCDYGSSFHFSGKVQPDSVNLYDCENGLSFRFRI